MMKSKLALLSVGMAVLAGGTSTAKAAEATAATTLAPTGALSQTVLSPSVGTTRISGAAKEAAVNAESDAIAVLQGKPVTDAFMAARTIIENETAVRFENNRRAAVAILSLAVEK